MPTDSLLGMQLIQITVVASIVWILTRTVARNQTHLSHLLWLVVLLKCVTPPIWASPIGVFSKLQNEPNVAATSFADDDSEISVREMPTPQAIEKPISDEFFFEPNIQDTYTAPIAAESDGVKFATRQHELPAPTHSVTLRIALFVWLVIGSVLLLGSLARAALFTRKIIARSQKHEELENLTIELSNHLGLRKPPRLIVTSCAVGPAIVGLFRTCVVIPRFIVERASMAQLKPIIGHELIHVRRGDLWLGLFRHFVRSLWWFHPLVWKTSHAVRESTERCCDEEVIASLGVTPTAYANALVDILQLKNELNAIPVVPGVRPFDITAKRLETIMNLGHGCRRRTPGWCWILALVFAALTLPGAKTVMGEAEETTDAATVVDSVVEQVKEKPITNRLPWSSLQRTQPEDIVIEPEDVLGIYVAGVLGAEDELPPVQLPDAANVPPALGFPFPVQKDGTIPLPFIDDPKVAGLTVLEAQALLVKSYADNKQILKADQTIILTMIRPRHVSISVKRMDGVKENRFELSLPAQEADLFEALTRTGGFPGTEVDSILVQRKADSDPQEIPLTYPATEPVPRLSDELITLQDGDVVIVWSGPLASLDKSNAELESTASMFQLEQWNLTLHECIQIALQNSHVTRSLGVRVCGHSAPSSPPLSLTLNADFAPTVYDAAIACSTGAENTVEIQLARVNTDISISDAEINVRDFIYEVSQAYWSLYVAWHKTQAFHTAWKTSDEITLNKQGEAQLRHHYFEAFAEVKEQQSGLRYLLGIAAKDGRILQPIDKPTRARVEFDWKEVKGEALFHSPELKRQRWRVKQNALQLTAAREKLLSELDTAELYRLLGAGKQRSQESELIDDLTESDFGEWQIGLQFTTPIGFRAELTQLRNAQLSHRRSEKRLEDLELEITHQLTTAFRRMRNKYRIAQKSYNTLRAYRDQLKAVEVMVEREREAWLPIAFEAKARLVQAEVDYFKALADYQMAIEEVHLRKGTLLQSHSCAIEGSGPVKELSQTQSSKFDADSAKKDRTSNVRFFLGVGPQEGENPTSDWWRTNAISSSQNDELSRPAVTSRGKPAPN